MSPATTLTPPLLLEELPDALRFRHHGPTAVDEMPRAVAAVTHLERRMMHAIGYRSRWVWTSTGRLHVLEAEGGGPLGTLVILHGIGDAAVHYRLVLGPLRKAFGRVIVPDLPAHGFSELPPGPMDAAALMDGLGEALDRLLGRDAALVYGNSMGGGAAIRFAQRSPARVRSLMLVSPGGAPVPPDDMPAFLDQFRIRSGSQGKAFMDKLRGSPRWYHRLLAPAVRATFDRPTMRDFVDRLDMDDFFDGDELGHLAMPILLVWGSREMLLPAHQLAFFRTHLPAGRWIEQPPWGHCPHMDAPRALVRRIVAWARTVATMRRPAERTR